LNRSSGHFCPDASSCCALNRRGDKSHAFQPIINRGKIQIFRSRIAIDLRTNYPHRFPVNIGKRFDKGLGVAPLNRSIATVGRLAVIAQPGVDESQYVLCSYLACVVGIQQPFELLEELVCFSAAQLGLDPELVELHRKRQPTISEHQQTITGYLRLRPFDDAEAAQLEQFLFEDACRLEQAAALMGRARISGVSSRPNSSEYLSEPELRRRIRRGLLKVEQLHAFTLAVSGFQS
jgi:hypothetical protein